MHENPEPNTAVPCDSFSSSPSGVTTRVVYGERSYQSYDDFRDSVLVPPALTTQNPGEAPLEQRHVPSAPRHRRANTEVITRQPSLLGNQDPVEKKNYSSHARAESLSSRFEAGGRTLVNWFQGKSGPVNLGLPSSTPATMSDSITDKRTSREICEPSVRTVPTNRLQKRMTHPSPLKQVTTPTHTRSFSWFSSKRQEEKEPELPEPADDEFLNLDVAEALFPSGSEEQSEAQKFEQLQANAENIIRQLQAAYKQRTFALHAALTEKNERQEELDEARTRIQHIKSQLDGMAEKVLEQDKAIKAMAEELEQEREARKREEEARLRSVKSSDTDSITDLGSDLATPKRSKRASAATFNSHDSGFESGDESSAESIFSKRNETIESPVAVEAPSLKSKSSQITLPVPQPPAPQAPPKESKPLPPPPQQSPQKPPQRAPQPRRSAYDRVIRGLTSTGLTGAFIRGSSKCSNCYGVPASEAWSVVGILKEENTGLKERISELEDVIEDCLGIVGP